MLLIFLIVVSFFCEVVWIVLSELNYCVSVCVVMGLICWMFSDMSSCYRFFVFVFLSFVISVSVCDEGCGFFSFDFFLVVVGFCWKGVWVFMRLLLFFFGSLVLVLWMMILIGISLFIVRVKSLVFVFSGGIVGDVGCVSVVVVILFSVFMLSVLCDLMCFICLWICVGQEWVFGQCRLMLFFFIVCNGVLYFGQFVGIMNLCLVLLCFLMIGLRILGMMLFVLCSMMVLLMSMFFVFMMFLLCSVVCWMMFLVMCVGVMIVNGVVLFVCLMDMMMLRSFVCIFFGGYLQVIVQCGVWFVVLSLLCSLSLLILMMMLLSLCLMLWWCLLKYFMKLIILLIVWYILVCGFVGRFYLVSSLQILFCVVIGGFGQVLMLCMQSVSDLICSSFVFSFSLFFLLICCCRLLLVVLCGFVKVGKWCVVVVCVFFLLKGFFILLCVFYFVSVFVQVCLWKFVCVVLRCLNVVIGMNILLWILMMGGCFLLIS